MVIKKYCYVKNKKCSVIPPNSGSGSTNMSCFCGIGARTSLQNVYNTDVIGLDIMQVKQTQSQFD